MADVSGITAALPSQQQMNPLQAATTIQGIQNSQVLNKLYQQDLLNKQQELQNLQLTNQTGQSTLAMAQRQRNGQLLFGLSNMSDKQLQGGGPIYQTLQSELNDGTIDAQRYPAMKAEIDKITQNGGDQDGSLYRPLLNRGLTYSMAGPEAAAFLTGTRETSTTPGGLTQVVQVPGLGSAPGTPTRNLGTPYGGGLTPQEGVQPITIYLSDGTSRQITGQEARQYQLNGLPPGLSWSPNGAQPRPVRPQHRLLALTFILARLRLSAPAAFRGWVGPSLTISKKLPPSRARSRPAQGCRTSVRAVGRTCKVRCKA